MAPGSLPLLLALLAVTATLVLPFGGWRVRRRRYSLEWFLAIHLPIPLIFLMRTLGGFSWRAIPLFVGATVLGHLLGGRLWRPSSG